jgi:hypothetical protein
MSPRAKSSWRRIEKRERARTPIGEADAGLGGGGGRH